MDTFIEVKGLNQVQDKATEYYAINLIIKYTVDFGGITNIMVREFW